VTEGMSVGVRKAPGSPVVSFACALRVASRNPVTRPLHNYPDARQPAMRCNAGIATRR